MKSMYATGQKGPDRVDESLAQTDGDRCPTCGEPIAAIVARAPGRFEIRPCGHDAGPVLVRDAAGSTVREREPDRERLIADGGELFFAAYGCGNRYYFDEGSSAPEVCPRDDCSAPKGGVYRDA